MLVLKHQMYSSVIRSVLVYVCPMGNIDKGLVKNLNIMG
jgi:hypothetical protein